MGANSSTGNSNPKEKSVYQYTVKRSEGQDVDLSIYNGKVLMIVNVASQCILTKSNYTQMSELYRKYKEKARNWRMTPSQKFLQFAVKYLIALDIEHRGLQSLSVIVGLEILAFPCNQFMHQEPGAEGQIQNFACTRFSAEFPIFKKVRVNGQKAEPLFVFLKSCKGGLLGSKIKWNFTKFLIDKNGHVVSRHSPTKQPAALEKEIRKLLEIQ